MGHRAPYEDRTETDAQQALEAFLILRQDSLPHSHALSYDTTALSYCLRTLYINTTIQSFSVHFLKEIKIFSQQECKEI